MWWTKGEPKARDSDIIGNYDEYLHFHYDEDAGHNNHKCFSSHPRV